MLNSNKTICIQCNETEYKKSNVMHPLKDIFLRTINYSCKKCGLGVGINTGNHPIALPMKNYRNLLNNKPTKQTIDAFISRFNLTPKDLVLIESKGYKIEDFISKQIEFESLCKELGITIVDSYANISTEVLEVSRYILDLNPDITPVSLNNLVYLVNSFSILFNESTLFPDFAESWSCGMIYPSLLNRYKDYSYNPLNDYYVCEPSSLNKEVKELIQEVVQQFGKYSSSMLTEMIKLGEPWWFKRNELGISENENLYNPVSHDIIKSHYQYYFNSFKQDNFSNNNLDFIGYYAKKVSQIVKTLF